MRLNTFSDLCLKFTGFIEHFRYFHYQSKPLLFDSSTYFFKILYHSHRICPRAIILNNITLRINKKFAPIPRDFPCLVCILVEKYRVTPEIFIDIMTIRSINCSFLHYWPLCTHLTSRIFFNLFSISLLLGSKLVAGKCDNF